MTPLKKKILIISTLNPYPFWAGSEKLWFDLVRDPGFREAFDFHVLLAKSPVTEEKRRVLEEEGVRCTLYRHFNVEFIGRNAYRLVDKLRGRKIRSLPWYGEISRDKYDLVLFNVAALADIPDLAFGVAKCEESGTPFWLLLQHGYEDYFPAGEVDLDAVTAISRSAKRFVFVSKRNRAVLERAICGKLTNGLTTVNALRPDELLEAGKVAAECPVIDGKARFFSIGRFSPADKAQHLILEALSKPVWNERDWDLTFIGISGFEREYLEKMAAFFGLKEERLMFVPHTPDVIEEIAERNLLVMPSYAEGTPFSMIEAMACGRPAVGTPVGGIPELIIDGKTGWLARTTAASDVAEALERAWQSKQRWNEIGKAARNHVEAGFNQAGTLPPILDALISDSR